jgi:hypothetical protein
VLVTLRRDQHHLPIPIGLEHSRSEGLVEDRPVAGKQWLRSADDRNRLPIAHVACDHVARQLDARLGVADDRVRALSTNQLDGALPQFRRADGRVHIDVAP